MPDIYSVNLDFETIELWKGIREELWEINLDLEKYLHLTCSIYTEFTEIQFGLVSRILQDRNFCKGRITSLGPDAKRFKAVGC